MKNSLKDLKLWQTKRNELHITDDVEQDWLEMQGLLDENMPVDITPQKTSANIARLLWALFAALIIAVLIYLLYHKNEIAANTPHPLNKTTVNKMASNNNEANSSTSKLLTGNNDSKINKPDSGSLTSDKAKNNDISINKPASKAFAEKSTNNNNVLSPGKQAADAKHHVVINTSVAKTSTGSASSNAADHNMLLVAVKKNGHDAPKGRAANGYRNNLVQANKSSHKQEALNEAGLKNDHKNPRSNSSTANSASFKLVDQKKNGYGNTYQQSNQTSQGVSNVNKIEYPAFLQILTSTIVFDSVTYRSPLITNSTIPGINKASASGKNPDSKKSKDPKPKTTSFSKFDYGILMGVNSSGSFTPKKQNSNFYGSLPVDAYFGVFGTYHLSNKWALGITVNYLSPQTVSGSYSHANASKIDSTQRLQISDSRKIYSVNVPIQIQYKVSDHISFTAGPVISMPVKQVNGSSVLQPAAIKADTIYFPKLTSSLNNTKYESKLNYGLSGGLIIVVNRFSFGASYLRGLSGPKIISDLGSYTSNTSTLQFMVGFKLNKGK
ncbi:MAG: hypothetical protein JWR67_1328 [Mucilaginibacter sp.]|nr:hypothetical protein [Mucilaginibacter sp.]